MARTPLFRTLILALQAARRENLKAQGLPPPVAHTASNWTRRKFIKTTATVGAIGLAGSLFSPTDAGATATVAPSIAIIGAGIAGLNAAYQLKKAGYYATVYEARPRIGGRMLSTDMGNGLIVDLGAELINTDHADMLALAEEFGIELFNRVEDAANFPFPNTAYFFNGASITESALIDNLRLFSAQITHDAALLDEDWDTYAPQFDALSVADYLELHADKIDKPYIIELFKDVIRSEYGAEAHESSALQLLFVLPVIDQQSVDLISYSDEMYSVVGGSDQITDALGSNLEGQIQLRMELKEIRRTANKFHLTFADGTLVVADIVIVTIPFPALNTVNILAPLPKLLRRFINEAGLGANEKLLAAFNNRFWRQESGFTGEAWSDLGFCVLWDATQRQPSRTDGALNFFLGGNQARTLENQSATGQGNQFVSRFNGILPGATSGATGKFIRSGWLRSRFTRGGYANYRPGQLTTFGDFFWVESDVPRERQEVSAGNLIFSGEHLSDAFYGFMNGGAQTGRLAAELAVGKITRRAGTS